MLLPTFCFLIHSYKERDPTVHKRDKSDDGPKMHGPGYFPGIISHVVVKCAMFIIWVKTYAGFASVGAVYGV
jgi:hypothetical protein